MKLKEILYSLEEKMNINSLGGLVYVNLVGKNSILAALLQALSNFSLLTDYFIGKKRKINHTQLMDNPFLNLYKEFLHNVYFGDKRIYYATEISEYMRVNTFLNYEQQIEGQLRFMCEEFLIRIKTPKEEEGEKTAESQLNEDISFEFLPEDLENNNSPQLIRNEFKDIFAGWRKVIKTCQICENESESYKRFRSITLDMSDTRQYNTALLK